MLRDACHVTKHALEIPVASVGESQDVASDRPEPLKERKACRESEGENKKREESQERGE